MEQKKIEEKLNRLCNEYRIKLVANKADLNMLLINFTKEYNQLWK